MKRIGYAMAARLPLVLCAVLLLSMVRSLSAAQWQQVGEHAAIIAMGLQNPKEGVRYAQDRMEQEPQEDEAVVYPVSGGDGAVPAVSSVIPPKGDGGGQVVEEQIGGGILAAGKVTVKNNSGAAYDFESLLNGGLPFDTAQGDGPQVLIVHTHATECYMSYYAGYYNADDVSRTTDTANNVVAVGEAIAQELRAMGIGVIHDETLHDSPEYSGAYSRSEQTISSYLKAYPSIRVVLDIHRDAMIYDDLTKVKPTVTVDGNKAAQVMLVVGATDTEELPNAYCEENIALAMQLHQAMETAHEGIMRPMYLVDARYNQGLTSGSLLIEVGTDANTLSEALYSGRLVGKQLGRLLS